MSDAEKQIRFGWLRFVETIGVVSIVASLIFVGLQMRQTHEIALATLYQMRSDAARELMAVQLESELLHEARVRADAGEPLSPYDSYVLDSAYFLNFNHFEGSHFLYQQGLLSDEHWESDLRAIGAMLNENPDLQRYWQEHKEEYRSSFARAVDDSLL